MTAQFARKWHSESIEKTLSFLQFSVGGGDFACDSTTFRSSACHSYSKLQLFLKDVRSGMQAKMPLPFFSVLRYFKNVEKHLFLMDFYGTVREMLCFLVFSDCFSMPLVHVFSCGH